MLHIANYTTSKIEFDQVVITNTIRIDSDKLPLLIYQVAALMHRV